MSKLYFSDLKEALRIAKERDKGVYKMRNGRYFVGTYEQATKRIGIKRKRNKNLGEAKMKDYITSCLFTTNNLAKKYEKELKKRGFKTKIRKIYINKNIFNYQVSGEKQSKNDLTRNYSFHL